MTVALEVPLGEVAKFIRGITFKPDDVIDRNALGAVECMRTKNVQKELDTEDVLGIPERFVNRKEQFLQEGDILVSSANSWSLLGKCSWVPALHHPTTLGGFISAIRSDRSRLDARYLFHWFNSSKVQEAVRNCGRQTTNISNLDLERCRRLLIPLPQIKEQRRIAAILDQAEALRSKRRQALAKLDTLTQSLFLEMFGTPTTIMHRWPIASLGNLLDFLTSGSRGWAEHYRATGDLFLRIQNVGCDRIDLQDIAYVHAPLTAESKRTRVQPGDVLLSITADLGRTGVIPSNLKAAYINQHLAILRTSKLNPRYLSAFLTNSSGRRQLLAKNREGVKAGLNFDDIRSVLIPVPPRVVQDRFSKRTEMLDHLATEQTLSLRHQSLLFASLQHRAFNGEL